MRIKQLYLAAVALLATACTAEVLPDEDAILVPDPTAPIELSGSAPIETATAEGAVTRTDASELGFKLYAIPSTSTTWPSTPYINGVSATLANGSGTARTISFGTYYWPVGGQSLKFVGVMNANGTGITVSSDGTITLTAGSGPEKDILLANNLTGNKKGITSNPNYMKFNRLMARLIIKPGSENKQEVRCNITLGYKTATYNVLSNSLNKSGSYISLSYNTSSATHTCYLTPGTTISKLTSVTAGGVSKGDITLTDSNGSATSINAEAGKTYTIEITAKATLVANSLTIDNSFSDGGDL